MSRANIGLVGDFDPEKTAHRGIEQCFALAGDNAAYPVGRTWIPTEMILSGNTGPLNGIDGIWCAPGSPYRNTAGALWAIEWARTNLVPFLGTCGGVQHALLEYARHVLGLKEADHAENSPGTAFPLLERLRCSLIETSQKIQVVEGSAFRQIYGADSGIEEYCCSYGLNPKFEGYFKSGPLEIVARSEQGEVSAVQLRGHPFFVGTLFQPERRALKGSIHPVVQAFFEACGRHR